MFNTSSSTENIYEFKINRNTPQNENVSLADLEEFLPKVSIFFGQKNYQQLETEIDAMLENKYVFLQYMHLFRKWHLGEFTAKCINKKTLNIHLTDMLLSSCTLSKYHLSDGGNFQLLSFEEAVKKFNVTLVREEKQIFVKYLREGSVSNLVNYSPDLVKSHLTEFKMADGDPGTAIDQYLLRLAKHHLFLKKNEQMNEEVKQKLLQYFCEKPILVDFNEDSSWRVYKALEMCHVTGVKFVLIGRGVEREKLGNLSIFENLFDLKMVDEGFFSTVRSGFNRLDFGCVPNVRQIYIMLREEEFEVEHFLNRFNLFED